VPWPSAPSAVRWPPRLRGVCSVHRASEPLTSCTSSMPGMALRAGPSSAPAQVR
jgi:hypothetical protein